MKTENMKKILLYAAAVAAMAVSAQTEAFAQEKRMAVVEFSASYLRLQPDYESPLETQELMGTVVEITGEKSYWREVMTPQPYKAWCTDQGLVEMTEDQLKAYEAAPKVMYKDLYGHIYSKPSLKSGTICDLVGGDLMRIVEKKGRWTKVMLPSGKTGYVPSAELKEHKGFTSIKIGEGNADSIPQDVTESIIAEAEKLLGVPYLWGGMSAKGVDCSGLVRISHIMNGILLPRNASQQVKCGQRVDLTDLQRGDLVFFGTAATEDKPMRITHVGIYIGNDRIIHSSHRVRINSLKKGDADYYENAHRLVAAIRL
jgi:uncharacterized protein YgiM (DUF1202 family)